MNRSEIVNAVAAVTADRAAAENVIRLAFDEIAKALRNGEKVVISNFGTFAVKVRSAHETYHPKTGEKIYTAERRKVRFKAAPALLD